MNKKGNIFADQTSSSRVERLKQGAINKTKMTYESGFHHKNNTNMNSVIEALSRVRGGGYMNFTKKINA